MASSLKRFLPQVALALFVLAVLAALAWSSLPANISRVKDWVPVAAPFIALLSLGTAVSVAYLSWMTPFAPVILARPFTWRMGPVTPTAKSFDIVFWITISNTGARPGSIDDLVVEVAFPKGRFLFQPIAFVKSEDYFLGNFGKVFEFPPFEGPFTPLFLGGRSQVTRAILFSPAFESSGFDPAYVDIGVHKISLYSRVQGGKFERSTEQKLVLEADLIAAWKAGGTVGAMVNHRDTNVANLLPTAI
jgi:hypothetical protein